MRTLHEEWATFSRICIDDDLDEDQVKAVRHIFGYGAQVAIEIMQQNIAEIFRAGASASLKKDLLSRAGGLLRESILLLKDGSDEKNLN